MQTSKTPNFRSALLFQKRNAPIRCQVSSRLASTQAPKARGQLDERALQSRSTHEFALYRLAKQPNRILNHGELEQQTCRSQIDRFELQSHVHISTHDICWIWQHGIDSSCWQSSWRK